MEELLLMFPALKAYVVYATTGVGAIVAFSTAFVAFARVLVKLTWWTDKDDKLLEEAEIKYQMILNTPVVGQILKIADRFSILKDTV